jgi:hypothetical protein
MKEQPLDISLKSSATKVIAEHQFCLEMCKSFATPYAHEASGW